MEGQLPLGAPALEAINLNCWWEFPSGWSLRLTARRSGRSWADGQTRTYDFLTTEELVDVLVEEVGRLTE